MTNTWEDVAWETETPRKEWVVEYYAKVGGETAHHLSVLHGENMEAVQRMLMHELRSTYTEASEIEVTILRMEEIETEPKAAMFNGAFFGAFLGSFPVHFRPVHPPIVVGF